MTFTAVIPARYASTRLPGKPLQLLAGRPLVQHVWERASASRAARVLVATDDERVAQCCRDFGAEVLLTRADHASGTDRLAEVAVRLGLPEEAVLVNVQGDEPLVPPSVIDQAAQNLAARPGAGVATLCEGIDDAAVLHDPNAVKVVCDREGYALYFSRAPIPWPRDGDAAAPPQPGTWWRHIGLYAYRAGFLRRFSGWAPAPPERLEALEQLRALYHGERIHVAAACAPVPGGVDTPADLEALRAGLAAGG